MSNRRSAGRPKVAVLNRELILRTALSLLDERGAHGFGMREIARDLGVRPSALYNHVRNKDEVFDGIRDLLCARFDLSGFDTEPWDVALIRWARSYRDSFAAHPPTIAVLAVQPLAPGSRAGLMYETVVGGLIGGGWPPERVLNIIVALESFIVGSVLDHAAPDDMLNPAEDAALPALHQAYASRQASLGHLGPADAAFDTGLQAIIAGFRAEFAQISSHGPSAGEYAAS
jgi:AcrR family transcriptional regulator